MIKEEEEMEKKRGDDNGVEKEEINTEKQKNKKGRWYREAMMVRIRRKLKRFVRKRKRIREKKIKKEIL